MRSFLGLYYFAHQLYEWRVPIIPRMCEVAYRVFLGAQIPAACRIGRDSGLNYGGLGLVVHPDVVIGENVSLGPGVTIGCRNGCSQMPVLGDNIIVGAGAKVLGPVHVGSGSVIGANAVVTKDVPPRSVAAGIPARITKTDIDVHDYGELPRDAMSST
ncbi:MAG: serine O-acetyltransferase [Coriobacteriia bacterium]